MFEARDCARAVGRAWLGAACERRHLPAHDLAQPVVVAVCDYDDAFPVHDEILGPIEARSRTRPVGIPSHTVARDCGGHKE